MDLFGGDGFIGTQTHLLLKFSFSSDFCHFIWKMVENAEFSYVSRKKILKYHHCWGNVPRWFFDCGGRVPRPPPPRFRRPCSDRHFEVYIHTMALFKSIFLVKSGWKHFPGLHSKSKIQVACKRPASNQSYKRREFIGVETKREDTPTPPPPPPPPPVDKLAGHLQKCWYLIFFFTRI